MTETKPAKQTYRIRNWAEYNAALIQRGSFTLWLDEAMIEHWYNTEKSGQRGASNTYADLAIQCALTLKAVYRLPLRATQGFLASLLDLMQVPLTTPHYSTCCRRQATLDVRIPRTSSSTEVRHLVVDSTGLKVFGEGEWKVRQHGYSKRRTWRKLHVAVDEATQEIVATLTTTNNVGDGEVLSDLLDQVPEPIDQVSADGSYDTRDCHEAIAQRQARAAIPPRENAQPWKPNPDGTVHPRTAILERIGEIGLAQWKKESGYHRRSLAETAMFRLKTLFGAQLQSRSFDAQVAEAYVRCAALNTMTRLGMPDSYRVGA
jgi:DDE family transposase